MDLKAIELIETITLHKDNFEPKIFEKGTVLKVIMPTPTSLLVSDDDGFSFTVALDQEDKTWHKL
ncbi:hypothetical protein [Acinetobacter guerrae]|uniref:hypothetical protein n=1 Tax=Acinetobacter guerrae TaxID=1843371 RepID=UPI00125F793E|nr:hypothetical protein [Acinetobacter guerrae]MPW43785.1 hypothetical protein [Acinetobacter guerrae]